MIIKPTLKPKARFSDSDDSVVRIELASYDYKYDYHISSGQFPLPITFKVIGQVSEKTARGLILDTSKIILPKEVQELHLVLEFGLWGGVLLRQYFSCQLDNFRKGEKYKIGDTLRLKSAIIPADFKDLVKDRSLDLANNKGARLVSSAREIKEFPEYLLSHR